MIELQLVFLAPAVLAVALAQELPVMELQMLAPQAVAVEMVQEVPTLELRVIAPQQLDATLLPILIGPPGQSAAASVSRTLTWSSGRLTGVDYADGRSKVLSWAGEQLTRVDRLQPAQPTRRADLAYNPDGTLASVTESVL